MYNGRTYQQFAANPRKQRHPHKSQSKIYYQIDLSVASQRSAQAHRFAVMSEALQ